MVAGPRESDITHAHRYAWRLWLGSTLLVVSLPALAAPPPVVTVAQGRLAGAADGKGGALFLGIPFAAPPVGSQRWRAPQPAAPWQGTRQATAEPPSCPQNDSRWNRVDAARGREDCLYLDVHTPRLDPAPKLPVLVWIHGGSNRAGSAAGTVRTNLVQKGIVVVAIQYRLGVLGFLSLPALSQEQGGSSGNYGLMDQIQALRWVHDNIARFGGDPERVTIAGQSAGGQDVGLLMVARGTGGLFAGAWATGGTPAFGQGTRTLSQNEAIGEQLPVAMGVAGTLDALRAAPVAQLLAGDLKLRSSVLTSNDYLWLQAIADGRVITQPPALSYAFGQSRRVPFVLSSNRIELQVPGGEVKIPRRLGQAFGADAAAALRYYGIGQRDPMFKRDASYGSLADRIGTDTDFRCTGDNVARMHAAGGSPTWRAQVSVESSGKASHHSAELPFLFDGLPLNASAPQVTLQAYLARFVKTGTPNGEGLPRWPRFVPGAEDYVDFTAAGVMPGRDLGGPICWLVNGV